MILVKTSIEVSYLRDVISFFVFIKFFLTMSDSFTYLKQQLMTIKLIIILSLPENFSIHFITLTHTKQPLRANVILVHRGVK